MRDGINYTLQNRIWKICPARTGGVCNALRLSLQSGSPGWHGSRFLILYDSSIPRIRDGRRICGYGLAAARMLVVVRRGHRCGRRSRSWQHDGLPRRRRCRWRCRWSSGWCPRRCRRRQSSGGSCRGRGRWRGDGLRSEEEFVGTVKLETVARCASYAMGTGANHSHEV